MEELCCDMVWKYSGTEAKKLRVLKKKNTQLKFHTLTF